MLAKPLNCFLWLAAGLLILFNPATSRAQNNSTLCESGFESRWGWKHVWKSKYNYNTGKLDRVYVNDYVYDCFPAESKNSSTNSKTKGEPWNFNLMAGKYSGEWVANFNISNVEDHIGAWDITIDSKGKITGFSYDKTSKSKGTIAGFVNENSFLKLVVSYSTEVEVTGVLEKTKDGLSGKLKQTCIEGICVDIDVALKQK